MNFMPIHLSDPFDVMKNLAIAGILFLCMRACTRRCQIDEIDNFLSVNISTAFSLDLLLAYWSNAQVARDDVINVFYLTAIFYVSVFIITRLMSFGLLKERVRPVAEVAVISDRTRPLTYTVLLLLIFPLLAYFTLSILSAGRTQAAVVLRDSTAMRLFYEGFGTLYVIYGALLAITFRRWLLWLPLIIYALAGPLTGSKGVMITTALMICTARGLLKPELHLKQLVKLAPLIPVVLAAVMAPLMIYGADTGTAVVTGISRFFLSGDVYYYLMVAARPGDFYNAFDWLTYLFHPFLALLGQRAYDLPLGSVLFSHQYGSTSIFGPNPQAPAIALVLFRGNLMMGTLYMIALAFSIVAIRYAALRFYLFERIPPVVRNLAFASLFFWAPALSLDLGSTQRYILSAVCCSIFLLFLALAAELGVRGSRERAGLSGGLGEPVG